MRHTASVFEVTIGVCLTRPPIVQEYRKVLVVADGALEAGLVATQMSACTSEMPVSTEVVRRIGEPEVV